MAKPKRPDSNSIHGVMRALDNAKRGIYDPPAGCTLKEGAQPFWEAIILARCHDEWDENQLQVASQLANIRADIVRLDAQLSAEGELIKTETGSVMVHPAAKILDSLFSRQASLMRSLQINATASTGRGVHLHNRRQTERTMRGLIAGSDAGGLSAKPADYDDDLLN